MLSFISGVRVIGLNCFKLKKDERVLLYKEWMRLREKLSFVASLIICCRKCLASQVRSQKINRFFNMSVWG